MKKNPKPNQTKTKQANKQANKQQQQQQQNKKKKKERKKERKKKATLKLKQRIQAEFAVISYLVDGSHCVPVAATQTCISATTVFLSQQHVHVSQGPMCSCRSNTHMYLRDHCAATLITSSDRSNLLCRPVTVCYCHLANQS